MQITETLALADLTALISVGIAAIVAITGYRSNQHSARQTFDNFTLRFIETENADNRLFEARQWLERTAFDAQQNLAAYADAARFFEHCGLAGRLRLEQDAEGAVRAQTDGSAEAEAALERYLHGREQIGIVLEARNTAAEAVLHGLLEENAYRLVRRRAFLHDKQRLQSFIAARQQSDPAYVQAFCRLTAQWGGREAT